MPRVSGPACVREFPRGRGNASSNGVATPKGSDVPLCPPPSGWQNLLGYLVLPSCGVVVDSKRCPGRGLHRQVLGRLTVVRASDERNRTVTAFGCAFASVEMRRWSERGSCEMAQLSPVAAGDVKGQKIFTVSVASKPIPHPTQNFLLAASDPTSLASAKTGLTVMTAAATLADAA
jgi:hypothetical protein